MDKYLEGPDAKRAKLNVFREFVGTAVSDSVALDCLNQSGGDVERAVNMFFNKLGSVSNPIELEEPEKPPGFIECTCLGSFNCSGSLTTKLAASSNELYMNTALNCSFSIKPPPSNTAFPNTPPELIDIMHGSGFVRFSHPKQKSEIGRLAAPLAAAICPLVLLDLAEISLSVGFPGCAGLNLNPGSTVPLRVNVFLTPKAMRSSIVASAFEDFLIEKIHACWSSVLQALGHSVTPRCIIPQEPSSSAAQESSDSTVPPNGDDPGDSMTDEMSLLVSEYAKADLPLLRPPSDIFPTELKGYQAQALFWMASREYPPELKGIPPVIRNQVFIIGKPKNNDADLLLLPPAWTMVTTSLFYNEGFFQKERPPPIVDCRGGILADEMGLGKTVMTLSLLSLDLLLPKPSSTSFPTIVLPSSSQIPGGTLIILHLSLLKQWVNELKRHCPALTFLEFHGADRSFDPHRLASVHVVFSTYGTVSVNSENGASPLMKIAWRRVVMDEAHTIRTRSTKMSKAVSRLVAERRWCLTGTPLQNSIEDIYPLVAWLRVYPWRSYAHFKKEVVNKLEAPSGVISEGLLNVQAMLKPLMIRRTKATKGLDGKPLVELPARRNKIVRIQMAPEEKDFYRALFWKTKLEFDKFEKSNAVMFNITHVLQLVVRLRQALCHPILCRAALADPSLADATHFANGVESLDDLLNKFMTNTAETNNNSSFFTNAIQDLKKIGIENLECPICLSEPCQFPIMTPCGHTMCRKCVMSRLRGECPICRFVFTNGDIQNINHLAQPQEIDEELDRSKTIPVCPPLSSKLKALLDYLARDMRKGRRVIVFSQFVSFLEIISRVFIAKKIPHRMLHGGHSTSQRENAIEWLNSADLSSDGKEWIEELSEHLLEVSDNEDEDDTPISERNQGRVLLVSLKAGGVGLNLVSANVVYLTDLWWNPATEEQAFQRVHRLGQNKKTLTYKFVCQDTIDERILDLQATKSNMSTEVLGDTQVTAGEIRPAASDRSRKLTLEDIRQLFNPQQGSFSF